MVLFRVVPPLISKDSKFRLNRSVASKNYQQHPFHLVDPSPWPLVASIAAGTMLLGGVMFFHGYNGGGFTLVFGMLGIVFVIFV